MRKLKFRAWDSYQNKMYDWNEICRQDSRGHLTLTNLLNNLIEHIKPMQYTGLKDKNGKEIYEGDVVEWKHSEQQNENEYYKERKVVEFHNGSFGFERWITKENNQLNYRNIHHAAHHVTPDLYYKDFDIKILGNIHQHRYLL